MDRDRCIAKFLSGDGIVSVCFVSVCRAISHKKRPEGAFLRSAYLRSTMMINRTIASTTIMSGSIVTVIGQIVMTIVCCGRNKGVLTSVLNQTSNHTISKDE